MLAANVLELDTSQTSGNQFRGEVDSVTGQEILARNFPAGASAPTDVIVPDREQVEQVTQKPRASSARSGPARAGERRRPLSVTLRDAPYSPAALDTIPKLARGGR